MKKCLRFACGTFLVVPLVWGGPPAWPITENFESYEPDQTFMVMTSGWLASTNTVKVQTATFFNDGAGGQKAVVLPALTELSNRVEEVSDRILWTDLRLVPQFGEPPAEPPTNHASVLLWFGPSGCLQIPTASGWESCSNSVLDPNLVVPTLVPGEWARISVYLNFTTSKAAVFVDGKLLRQNVAFPGDAGQYHSFRARSWGGSSYLDEYGVHTNYPATLTVDGNANGMPDALELMLYGGRAAVVRRVSPGGPYTDLQSALNAASSRDIVDVAAGVYSGNVTCSVAAVTFRGAAFTNQGTFTVAEDVSVVFEQTATFDSVVVGTNGLVTIRDATLESSLLTVQSGARIVVTGGVVVANGLTLSGSFTLTDMWGSQARPPLPFSDDFEVYAVDTHLRDLGYRGWAASDSRVVVQSDEVNGGSKAVVVPTGMVVSNCVDSANSKRVWMDVEIAGQRGPAPLSPPTNSASVVMYLTTNGFLAVATATGWDVCDRDAWNLPVAAVAEGGWARVTVMNNYSNNTAALFLGGRLLRQELPFVGNSTSYKKLSVHNFKDNAYVDDVAVAASSIPENMNADGDGDGYADAYEIHVHGNTWTLVLSKGSIYLIR